MTNSTARYFARQAYRLAMMTGTVRHAEGAGGLIAVYHQGLCYVFWRNGFDGVRVITPAKCWL